MRSVLIEILFVSMTKTSPIITPDLYNHFVSLFQSRYQTKPFLYNELFDLFQQVNAGLDPVLAQDELDKLVNGRFKELNYVQKDILLSVRYQRDQSFRVASIAHVLTKHNIDIEKLENYL